MQCSFDFREDVLGFELIDDGYLTFDYLTGSLLSVINTTASVTSLNITGFQAPTYNLTTGQTTVTNPIATVVSFFLIGADGTAIITYSSSTYVGTFDSVSGGTSTIYSASSASESLTSCALVNPLPRPCVPRLGIFTGANFTQVNSASVNQILQINETFQAYSSGPVDTLFVNFQSTPTNGVVLFLYNAQGQQVAESLAFTSGGPQFAFPLIQPAAMNITAGQTYILSIIVVVS